MSESKSPTILAPLPMRMVKRGIDQPRVKNHRIMMMQQTNHELNRFLATSDFKEFRATRDMSPDPKNLTNEMSFTTYSIEVRSKLGKKQLQSTLENLISNNESRKTLVTEIN